MNIPANYYTKAMEVWQEREQELLCRLLLNLILMLMIMNYLIYAVKERRVELAFENHRFLILVLGKSLKNVTGVRCGGMNVETTGSGDVTPDSFWERTVFEKRVFKKQHYLYPFTQTEISFEQTTDTKLWVVIS